MRLGILSDTHDRVERTRAAVGLLMEAGAEFLIHCGDITIPEVVYELAPLPSLFVFGNCDDDPGPLRQAIESIGGICLGRGGVFDREGHRLAVTHGDSARELARLEAERPEYLFTGHTHQAHDLRRGPTRHINPGALHRAPDWTVGLLDCRTGHLETLHIVENKLQP